MSKRFKGKTCVYCSVEGISETADHVIAREFLPVAHRDGIPKVAACRSCNNAKSHLEHYLLAVLPFGSRHPTASAMLKSDVPRRLAGNRRLHRDLAGGQEAVWLTENGIKQPTIALPFDGQKLSALFALVTRGLAAHHFGLVIPRAYAVDAGLLVPEAEQFMQSLFMMNARAKVTQSLANGLLSYDGAQFIDDPYRSVWRYRVFGGVRLVDSDHPEEMPDTIWATSTRSTDQSVFGL